MNKKAIVLSLSLAALSCLPLSSSLAAGIPAFKSNKAMTEYFWNEVFNKHNTAVIDSMVGADYKQHSPEFADGKAAFKNGVTDFLKPIRTARPSSNTSAPTAIWSSSTTT
ncbi:MAG: hypothetical protein U0J30_07215, partial [Megasphaera sp.]|nr:hypothetical protein [Megasphaera sp.]